MSLENYLSAKSRDRHHCPSIETIHNSSFYHEPVSSQLKQHQQNNISDNSFIASPNSQYHETFHHRHESTDGQFDTFHHGSHYVSDSPLIESIVWMKNGSSIFPTWKKAFAQLKKDYQYGDGYLSVHKDAETVSPQIIIRLSQLKDVQKSNYKSPFGQVSLAPLKKKISHGLSIVIDTSINTHTDSISNGYYQTLNDTGRIDTFQLGFECAEIRDDWFDAIIGLAYTQNDQNHDNINITTLSRNTIDDEAIAAEEQHDIVVNNTNNNHDMELLSQLDQLRADNEVLSSQLQSFSSIEAELATTKQQLTVLQLEKEQLIVQKGQNVNVEEQLKPVIDHLSSIKAITVEEFENQRKSISKNALMTNDRQSQIETTIRKEIKSLSDPIKTIKEALDKYQAGSEGKQVIETGLKSIGNSLSTITEYLSKNMDLQNHSDKTIHDKLDTIASRLQTGDSIKSNNNSNNSLLVNSIRQEIIEISRNLVKDNTQAREKLFTQGFQSIEQTISEKTSKLHDICSSLQQQIADIKSQPSVDIVQSQVDQDIIKLLERRLDNINAGIDQTQSMVLSGSNSAFEQALKQLSGISDNLQVCLDEFDKVKVSQLTSQSKSDAVESTFTAEFCTAVETKLSNIDKNVNDILSARKRPAVINHGRTRSLSPHKLCELGKSEESFETIDDSDSVYGEGLQYINRNLISLKSRLNSYISSSLTDDNMKNISSQLSDLILVNDKIKNSMQSLKDNVHESDKEWKTELRHIMRANHEQMLKLQQNVETTMQQSLVKNSNNSVNEKLQEKLLESISQLLNGNFSALSEDLQQIQQTYTRSLNELLQDRELLMHENQRLLNDIDELKQQKRLEFESKSVKAEQLQLEKLKLEKDRLNVEIQDQARLLESLKAVTSISKQQEEKKDGDSTEEALNRSRIQMLLAEIDALKVKRTIISDMLISKSTTCSKESTPVKKRSTSLTMKE